MPLSHGGDWKLINILVGKYERKRPLRRFRRKFDNNVKIDHEDVGYDGVDWIHITHNRVHLLAVVEVIIEFWVP
jgi:hypothetical protein